MACLRACASLPRVCGTCPWLRAHARKPALGSPEARARRWCGAGVVRCQLGREGCGEHRLRTLKDKRLAASRGATTQATCRRRQSVHFTRELRSTRLLLECTLPSVLPLALISGVSTEGAKEALLQSPVNNETTMFWFVVDTRAYDTASQLHIRFHNDDVYGVPQICLLAEMISEIQTDLHRRSVTKPQRIRHLTNGSVIMLSQSSHRVVVGVLMDLPNLHTLIKV